MVRVSTFFPLRNPLNFPAISINGQILGVRLIPTSCEFLTSGSCERERVVFRLLSKYHETLVSRMEKRSLSRRVERVVQADLMRER